MIFRIDASFRSAYNTLAARTTDPETRQRMREKLIVWGNKIKYVVAGHFKDFHLYRDHA